MALSWIALAACSGDDKTGATTDSGTDATSESRDATPDVAEMQDATPDVTESHDAMPDVAIDVTCLGMPSLTAYNGPRADCIAQLETNHAGDLAACQRTCGCPAFLLNCLQNPGAVGVSSCLSAAQGPVETAIFDDTYNACEGDAGPGTDAGDASPTDAGDAGDAH